MADDVFDGLTLEELRELGWVVDDNEIDLDMQLDELEALMREIDSEA